MPLVIGARVGTYGPEHPECSLHSERQDDAVASALIVHGDLTMATHFRRSERQSSVQPRFGGVAVSGDCA
jgi:hypothetical protein